MKSSLFIVTVGICASVCSSDVAGMKSDANMPTDHPTGNKVIQAVAGGMVWQPFTGIGQLVIINRQTDVSIGELEPVRPVIMEETHINIVLSNEERRGELCIFVDDSESDRALCVYPEQNEAHVNVRVLKADGTKGERLAARTRKEILRAFAFIAGGASSAAEISLLGKVSKPSDLDLLRERIPNEVEMRFPSYLKKIGITPYRCVTYSLACEEGWALAPTNKHQKAIWDKVHAMPTEPIKIKPEAKKTEK